MCFNVRLDTCRITRTGVIFFIFCWQIATLQRLFDTDAHTLPAHSLP